MLFLKKFYFKITSPTPAIAFLLVADDVIISVVLYLLLPATISYAGNLFSA